MPSAKSLRSRSHRWPKRLGFAGSARIGSCAGVEGGLVSIDVFQCWPEMKKVVFLEMAPASLVRMMHKR